MINSPTRKAAGHQTGALTTYSHTKKGSVFGSRFVKFVSIVVQLLSQGATEATGTIVRSIGDFICFCIFGHKNEMKSDI